MQTLLYDIRLWKKKYSQNKQGGFQTAQTNPLFIKYVTVYKNLLFYKLFFFHSVKRKKDFLALFSAQLSNLFQHLNFSFFENQIETALTAGQKYGTFYPNH
jgi:hypothetical protein